MFLEFLLGVSEGFPCPGSAVPVNTVPQLDALQLVMLSAGMLTYLRPNVFLIMILLHY
jgi:hypothetical protein